MNSCPRRSIQTPHLFVAVVWWLVFFVIPLFILKELLQMDSTETKFYNLIFDVVTIATGFPIIFFSYRILHFLMKYRFFNMLIEYTSFTRFKFWRRYLAPKQFIKVSRKI
jgi:hypothetical protein